MVPQNEDVENCKYLSKNDKMRAEKIDAAIGC